MLLGNQDHLGKTRYLFKNIRDTRGTFHEKIDTIKDRNGMDLTKAKDIRKQKNCTKKFRKQQLEPDMKKQTGSKLGKEYVKAVYFHPVYLISIQIISCEMLGWMKHKLESRLLREISVTSDRQMTPSLWQKVKN